MTAEEALQRYYAKLAERSIDSADSICRPPRDLFKLVQVADLDALSRADLEQYRTALAARAAPVPVGKPVSLSTVFTYIACVRLFLLYCLEQGWLSLTKEDITGVLVAKPAKVVHPYEVLSEKEIARVMAAADDRQRAMLALGLFAGLRIGEIIALRVRCIVDDRARGQASILVERGKGNKGRRVPIAPDVAALLLAYCGARQPESKVFNIGRERARQVIETPIRAAGIVGKISPHSLRHTYAYRLAKAGVPLLAIKQFLGHSSLETTQRYIEHLTMSELAEYAPGLVL